MLLLNSVLYEFSLGLVAFLPWIIFPLRPPSSSRRVRSQSLGCRLSVPRDTCRLLSHYGRVVRRLGLSGVPSFRIRLLRLSFFRSAPCLLAGGEHSESLVS